MFARLKVAIAAARSTFGGADRAAAVAIRGVSVVTFFNPFLDVAIAAGRRGTVSQAFVVVRVVSIVALFIARLAGNQSLAQIAVAACCRGACGGACAIVC